MIQETTQEAFGVITTTMSRLEHSVYNALRIVGSSGLTDEEGAVATNLYKYTYAPRRTRLMHRGLVVDSGRRRLTKRYRNAIVWVLREHAPQITGGTM